MSLIKAENFISGLHEDENENEEDFKSIDPKKILGKVFYSKWRKKCTHLINFFFPYKMKLQKNRRIFFFSGHQKWQIALLQRGRFEEEKHLGQFVESQNDWFA